MISQGQVAFYPNSPHPKYSYEVRLIQYWHIHGAIPLVLTTVCGATGDERIRQTREGRMICPEGIHELLVSNVREYSVLPDSSSSLRTKRET